MRLLPEGELSRPPLQVPRVLRLRPLRRLLRGQLTEERKRRQSWLRHLCQIAQLSQMTMFANSCSIPLQSGVTTTRHSNTHAMQCILTRADHDLFYGEAGSAGGGGGHHMESSFSAHAFTCPFCAKLGFTEISLVDHVASQHADATQEVVCPICASGTFIQQQNKLNMSLIVFPNVFCSTRWGSQPRHRRLLRPSDPRTSHRRWRRRRRRRRGRRRTKRSYIVSRFTGRWRQQ